MGGEGNHGLAPAPADDADRAPFRKRSDAAIARDSLRHLAEQERIEALRPPMGVDSAKVILQRKGRVVYRASVAGGRADRWYVSGRGKDVTDAQLIEMAERVASVVARPA